MDRQYIWTFPQYQMIEDQNALKLCLMLTGTSVEQSAEAWRAYLTSYTVAMFPELLCTSSILQIRRFEKKKDIDPQLDMLKHCIKLAKKADSDAETLNTLSSGFKLHPLLPAVGQLAGCAQIGLEARPKYFFSHYALVLYLARMTRENEDHDVVERNFHAVQQVLATKARIDEKSNFFLSGPAKLSRVSKRFIAEAWSDLSPLRHVCFSEFCKFSATQKDLRQDLVYLSIQKLRYSGFCKCV